VKFQGEVTLRQLFALCLALALALPLGAYPRQDERAYSLPAPLVNELDQWIAQADFWRLVTRGEYILARIEISEKESPAVEAWLCGPNHICLTTGLRRYLSDTELQAAIAHEIGHIVIPHKIDSHLQLWETQCDLFAAALLRDADLVKSMLYAVNRACRNCTDQQHLAPLERAALLDYSAEQPLEKVRRLDALRASEFSLPLTSLTEFTLPKRTMP
jgi:Peptidase family M48